MDKQLAQIITQYLNDHRDQFIDDLRGLLAFNSVKGEASEGKPFGNEVANALDYMQNLCQNAGLKTRNFDYYCMDADYGEGDEVVASLSHLDIVPAGEGWKHPPFAGEMEGSIMYGRGVGDDKGPAMAGLYALKALMHADAKTNRKLRLIFGCDEETGMTDMAYYLSKVDAPDYAFSPDAQFPAIHAEKHGVGGTYTTMVQGTTALLKLSGGTVANAVPGVATATIRHNQCPESTDQLSYVLDGDQLTITAQGIAAHASCPEEGDNAVIRVIDAVLALIEQTDPVYPILQSTVDHMRAYDGSGLGVACQDEVSGPLTMNLGIISYTDQVISIVFDIRHPVTVEVQPTMDALVNALPLFDLARIDMHYGLHRPKDGPLVKTLMEVYNEITGSNAEPMSMGGGTYARTLPNAVAFGPKLPDGKFGGAHTVDEYGDVDELLYAARIYAHCFYRLGNL